MITAFSFRFSLVRFMPVQGFVLGQYGLLYALTNEQDVDRLFILNTPLALNSKLRPELAAYKRPISFLRPGNVSQQSWAVRSTDSTTRFSSFVWATAPELKQSTSLAITPVRESAVVELLQPQLTSAHCDGSDMA